MATTIYSNSIAITKAPKDGVSVVSIAKKYLLTTTDTPPSKEENEWLDEPPVMTETNKYLWAYDIVTYSDESTTETDITCIGVCGEGAVDCYLSPDSFVLPVNEYGVISNEDYDKVQIVVSLIQKHGGSYKSLTASKTLSANGTFTIAASSDTISSIVVSGSLVKTTAGSAILAGYDVAYIDLNIKYLDFSGAEGSFQKKICITKAKAGKTGAYTLHQWCLSSSYETPPDNSAEWQDVMPNIANTENYLWVRKKEVSPGTDPFSISWDTPELETTLKYSIGNTALIMGNKQITLDASKVILGGTVTAQQLNALNFISSKSFLVNDGGSLRSSAYDENGNNETDEPGFYLNSQGIFKAVKAILKSTETYDLRITGGEIKGETNPLNTVLNEVSGASYSNKEKTNGYRKKSDVSSYVLSHLPEVNRITPSLDGFYQLQQSSVATIYEVANVSPTDYYTLSSGSSGWTETQTKSNPGGFDDYGVYDITYTFPFPEVGVVGAVCKIVFTSPIQKYEELWVDSETENPIPDVTITNYYYNKYVVWNTWGVLYYKINNGSYSSFYYENSRGEKRDRTMYYQYLSTENPSVSTGPFSFYIYLDKGTPAGTITLKWSNAKKGFYQNGNIGSSPKDYAFANPDYISTNYFYSPGSFSFSQKDNIDSGKYIVDSNFSFSSLTAYLNNISSEYLYLPQYNGATVPTSDYATFNGVLKDGASFSGNIFSAIKDFSMGGVDNYNGGYGIASITSGSVAISQNDVPVLVYEVGKYYLSSSIYAFSFTILSASKGVYVTDLFRRKDTSGNLLGEGKIGAAGQEFSEVYTKKLPYLFPVGSTYLCKSGVDPNNFLGNTWALKSSSVSLGDSTYCLWERTS